MNYNGTRSMRAEFRPWLRYYHELERRGTSEGTCYYLGYGYLWIRNVKTNQSPLNGRIVLQVRGVSEERNGLKTIIFTHGGGALTAKREESDGIYWSFLFQKGLGIYNKDNVLCDRKAREQIKKFGLIVVEGFFEGAPLIEAGCFHGRALMGMQLCTKQRARLKFIGAHAKIIKIKVFLDRDVPGVEGIQKALYLLKSNGFQGDIFNRDQIVCHCKGSLVKIPEKIKDVGDMSAKQLQWLRENREI